ncbi:hypothetical protein D7X48_19435 [bacterium D16-50]|nr:hypothetical protein D7X48_19435 [bacterium D16-50]
MTKRKKEKRKRIKEKEKRKGKREKAKGKEKKEKSKRLSKKFKCFRPMARTIYMTGQIKQKNIEQRPLKRRMQTDKGCCHE